VILVGFLGLIGLPSVSHAADLLYRTDHFLFTVPASDVLSWTSQEDAWTYAGEPVTPPQRLLADGDEPPIPPRGFARSTRAGYSENAIRETLRARISDQFDREPGSVTIDKTASGTVTFDGVGLPGREADLDALVPLTIAALRQGLTDIEIPVIETQPAITVASSELRDLGIAEVVTVGESVYAGSPVNRRHNIATGLARFNGHVIPQGTVFSFDQVLGRVDGTTGYRKELVIKGARTEPDYGGGLCQVSSTAYRGAWEHGFPIEQRINHSYAVSYYGPVGTDATVYPPNPDVKFTNDGPSALLIQTYSDENDHAYFIYYGTKDARESGVYGPFIWNRSSPPPDKTIETTELPPGQRRKVGDRHPGLNAAWVRYVTMPDGTTSEESTVSIYQARPLFYEVGVGRGEPAPEPGEQTPPSIDEPPSWIDA
jgi:vancomycin resistance protein YoaR